MTLFTPDAARERNTRDWIDWGTDGGGGGSAGEGRDREQGGEVTRLEQSYHCKITELT